MWTICPSRGREICKKKKDVLSLSKWILHCGAFKVEAVIFAKNLHVYPLNLHTHTRTHLWVAHWDALMGKWISWACSSLVSIHHAAKSCADLEQDTSLTHTRLRVFMCEREVVRPLTPSLFDMCHASAGGRSGVEVDRVHNGAVPPTRSYRGGDL